MALRVTTSDLTATTGITHEEQVKYADKTFEAMTDKLMLTLDSHEKCARATGGMETWNLMANIALPMKMYRQKMIGHFTTQRYLAEIKIQLRSAIKASISQLSPNRKGLVNGANSWKGNGIIRIFKYENL